MCFGSSSPKTISTLDAGQKAVSAKLSPYLAANIGTATQPYGGQLVAGLSPLEQQTLSRYYALGQGQTGAQTPLQQGRDTALMSAMSGKAAYTYDPVQSGEMFNQAVYNPSLAQYRQDVLPEMRAPFGAPGGGWASSGHEVAEGRAASDFMTNMAGQRAQWQQGDITASRASQESALGRQLQGAEGATQAGMADLAGLGQQMQAGGLERQLEQNKLQALYDEFIRTRPEYAPFIQQAINYLGIPTMAGYQPQQRSYGALGSGLGTLGGYLLGGPWGAAVGSAAGGGIGSMF